MSGKRSRPIEAPAPGESSGFGCDLAFRMLCAFVELCVIMTGVIIVGTLLV
ncbi:MAG TPA: hypothetical protein VF092_16070 [Longimicrobium sp.]